MTTRIVAREDHCSCHARGDCAACLLAYDQVVTSDRVLAVEYVIGGDLCADCADAVEAAAPNGAVLTLGQRWALDALVGRCGAGCKASQSHRYVWPDIRSEYLSLVKECSGEADPVSEAVWIVSRRYRLAEGEVKWLLDGERAVPPSD